MIMILKGAFCKVINTLCKLQCNEFRWLLSSSFMIILIDLRWVRFAESAWSHTHWNARFKSNATFITLNASPAGNVQPNRHCFSASVAENCANKMKHTITLAAMDTFVVMSFPFLQLSWKKFGYYVVVESLKNILIHLSVVFAINVSVK